MLVTPSEIFSVVDLLFWGVAFSWTSATVVSTMHIEGRVRGTHCR